VPAVPRYFLFNCVVTSTTAVRLAGSALSSPAGEFLSPSLRRIGDRSASLDLALTANPHRASMSRLQQMAAVALPRSALVGLTSAAITVRPEGEHGLLALFLQPPRNCSLMTASKRRLRDRPGVSQADRRPLTSFLPTSNHRIEAGPGVRLQATSELRKRHAPTPVHARYLSPYALPRCVRFLLTLRCRLCLS